MDHEATRNRRTNAGDIHVGSRIRIRRSALDMSQEELAKRLGVSYQQVQKYERGTNRTTAGRLFHIAEALGVDITYFYEGMPSALANEQITRPTDKHVLLVMEFVSSTEGVQLISDFMKIKGRRVRKHLIKFMNYLARNAPPENQG